MKNLKILCIAVLLSSLAHAQVTKHHNQALKQIVEDFRTSIIEHNDEEKFNKMELKNWVQGYKEYDEGERIKGKPYFISISKQSH